MLPVNFSHKASEDLRGILSDESPRSSSFGLSMGGVTLMESYGMTCRG